MVALGTLAGLLEHRHRLYAYCPPCDRWRVLPLADLVAQGHGSRRLPLRVRCRDCSEVGRLHVPPARPKYVERTGIGRPGHSRLAPAQPARPRPPDRGRCRRVRGWASSMRGHDLCRRSGEPYSCRARVDTATPASGRPKSVQCSGRVLWGGMVSGKARRRQARALHEVVYASRLTLRDGLQSLSARARPLDPHCGRAGSQGQTGGVATAA